MIASQWRREIPRKRRGVADGSVDEFMRDGARCGEVVRCCSSSKGGFGAEEDAGCGGRTIGGLLAEVVSGAGRIQRSLDFIDSYFDWVRDLVVGPLDQIPPGFENTGRARSALPEQIHD